MLLRLKLYQLLLKIAAYSLPFAGYHIGLRMWSFILPLIDRPTNFVGRGHFGMLLFGCFVWALLAEHYKVTSVEELFRERTGARAVCSACLATSVVLLAILYFSRKADFPRGLEPKNNGYDLWVVYLVWLLVVALLFPLCWWYARVKARARPSPTKRDSQAPAPSADRYRPMTSENCVTESPRT